MGQERGEGGRWGVTRECAKGEETEAGLPETNKTNKWRKEDGERSAAWRRKQMKVGRRDVNVCGERWWMGWFLCCLLWFLLVTVTYQHSNVVIFLQRDSLAVSSLSLSLLERSESHFSSLMRADQLSSSFLLVSRFVPYLCGRFPPWFLWICLPLLCLCAFVSVFVWSLPLGMFWRSLSPSSAPSHSFTFSYLPVRMRLSLTQIYTGFQVC